jgi:AraC-like DNA-binding protein
MYIHDDFYHALVCMPFQNDANSGSTPSSPQDERNKGRRSDKAFCLSPFSHLMQQAIGRETYVHQPFPGISLELLPACILDKECRLRTTTGGTSHLSFCLRLSGSSTIHIDSNPPQEIVQRKYQIVVSHFPAAPCEVCIHAATHCLATVVVTPKALRERCRSELPEKLIRLLRHEDGLCAEVMGAPPRLVEIARNLFTPPVLICWRQMYLDGVCFEFLAVTLEALLQTQRCGSSAFLSDNDVIQVTNVRQYIETHPTEVPSVHDLCKMFYLNEFKLKSGFRRLFSTTIAAYARYCRLNHAHNRLMRGETNASQCAWEIGYTNVSHFIAAFRRQYGYTPGELISFRKQN